MANTVRDLLGNGLITPLRRLAGLDFVSASGELLVRSAVQQIMKTERGQMPWRPSFSGGMERFRNRSMAATALEEAEAQAMGSIGAYEPRARVLGVKAERLKTMMRVQIAWGVVPPESQESTSVLLGPFTTEVTI